MGFWRWKKSNTERDVSNTNVINQRDGGNATEAKAPKFNVQNTCVFCLQPFRFQIRRRHHCRNCGESCCKMCLSVKKYPIPWFNMTKPQKVCQICALRDFLQVQYAPCSEAEPSTIMTYSRRCRRSGVVRPVKRTYRNKLWPKIRPFCQRRRRVQFPFDVDVTKPIGHSITVMKVASDADSR